MPDQTAKPNTAPTGDARDILARLYREIGISAVAAALQMTSKPETKETEEIKRERARRSGGMAA